MLIKTSELEGEQLNWAVAKCEGTVTQDLREMRGYCYSTNWAQGGPIIEREKIELGWTSDGWYANMYWRGIDCIPGGAAGQSLRAEGDGDTILIAAMRCYVASQLGDEGQSKT